MASREQDLIQRCFAPLAAGAQGAFGLHDDAALIAPAPGEAFVATVDALVAGVHFFADDAPGLVARKALRVNLSDLIAKGAAPAWYLLAIAMPRDLEAGWLEAFTSGLAADQEEFGCALIGGDTVSTDGPLTLSVTAIGRLPEGAMVHRHGAGEGDAIYVTGTVGDAALHLALKHGSVSDPGLDDTERTHLRSRYEVPQPRLAMVEAVRAYASASMDISDGLAGDLTLMCEASGVGAAIDLSSLPLSDAAARIIEAAPDAIEQVATGGDDYEILCCVPPSKARDFEQAARDKAVRCTRIGAIGAAGSPVSFRGADGAPVSFAHSSYSHI